MSDEVINDAPLRGEVKKERTSLSQAGALLPLLIAVAASLATDLAAAQSPVDLFKDKTINLVIAAGEGGGFDIAARLAARHLARFLPGAPSVVPQNMPGAN